jgi:hypothetical protein
LSQERLARIASVVVGVAAFAGYALACAPSAYLLDSAELAQAAFGLGVAHPPGEPVAALWGRLFCFLPLGSVALRVGLGQAVAGAAAAVLLLRIALRLLALLDEGGALDARARVALAAAAALGFAYAPGVVNVSARPEVYALQTALSLGAVLCALRALDEADARSLLLAALLLGLGVANHPLVAGLTGVGATLAAFPFLRAGRARLVAFSVLALFLGMAVIVYLPVRATALFAQAASRGADTILWGDPRTPGGLAWVLSARTFAEKAAIVHTAASPLDFPFALMDELEVVFTTLAPVGMVLVLRRRRVHLAGAVLVGSWAGSSAAALVGGFDPANPDVRGYLGPAIALTAVFSICAIAVGLTWLERWKRPWLVPALAGSLALATLTRFPASGTYPGLRHAGTADRVAGELLGQLPPRATLLTAHFESAFVVGYQRVVEGRRPDVAWAHQGFFAHPGASERLGRAEPSLLPLIETRVSPVAVVVVDRQRPVRLEPDQHLDRRVRAHLVPDGWTWRLGGPLVRPRLPELPPAVLAEAAGDRLALHFVGWRLYNDATVACENGLTQAAPLYLGMLRQLSPQDVLALKLGAECDSLSRKRPFLRKAP